jgi:peptide/nickel transport system substrate-binding protein/oligopeptide transport system substrate-binding protein
MRTFPSGSTSLKRLLFNYLRRMCMRLGFRKASLASVMMLLLTVLAACGSGGGGGGATKAPDDKQILRRYLVAASADVKQLDPARITDFYSYFPAYLTYPALVTLDDQLQVTPWAADGMPTVSADGKTYTFKVKQGMKWSDGTPIDANVFAYSINRTLNPCTKSLVASYLYPIANAAAFNGETCNADGKTAKGAISTLIGTSITATDAQTLVIKLAAPAAYFLEAMTYPTSFAVPQSLIDQYGLKNWTDHLADNGGFGGNLFKITSWDHKGHLTLVRNDSFWGTKPVLKEVDFTVYKTTDTEYADYQTGHLEVGTPPSAQYQQAKSKPGFHEAPVLDIGYLQPNWKKAPFDDVRVRQALSLALDRDSIANKVLAGLDLPTYHIVPQGMPGYNPNLTGPNGVTSLSGDPTQAASLMKAYATDKCGGDLTKCAPVTFTVSNDTDTVKEATAELAMWQQAFPGYPMKLATTDFNTLLDEAYSASPPQLIAIGWIADYPDPQDWLSLQFGPNASNNTGNVHFPQADALMNQADANLDPTTRMQEYNQAEQLLVNQGAWLPVTQNKAVYLTAKYLHGYSVDALGYPTLATWQQAYVDSH